MFRKIFFRVTLFAVLGGVLSIVWIFHFPLRERDRIAYQLLVQESATLRARHPLEHAPAYQLREGVRKDLWMVEGGKRHHLFVESAISHLTLSQKKDKILLFEKMEQIVGADREKNQTWTAERGEVHFPFLGRADHCQFHQGEDHFEAKRVFFSIKDRELSSFFPRGKAAARASAFSADTGYVSYCKKRPQTIVLEGSVNLSEGKEREKRAALADAAIFHKGENKLLLLSAPDQRVLFWQEGMELSAPEIWIEGERVLGIGDVRFSLNAEEQGLMEKISP